MKRRAGLGLLLAGVTTAALAQFGGRRGKRGGDDQKKSGEEPQVNQIEVTIHEFHEDLKLTIASPRSKTSPSPRSLSMRG